jgi:hypothetical protein
MDIKELPIDLMMKTVEWEAVTDYQKSDDELPSVTHNGVLTIDGISIRCYQLDSGIAVFDADDIESLFRTDEK